MIKKFHPKNIDKAKYTSCLQKSVNYRIYAELWYLSTVSPHGYDIWVLDDYKAVMPVPFQKKLTLKLVIQPEACQQLGVFYPEEISQKNFDLFVSVLHTYRIRSYNFNESNTKYFSTKNIRRFNQIMHLNSSYESMFNQYEKDKKKILKREKIKNLKIIEGFNLADFQNLTHKKLFPYYNKKQISIIHKLLLELNQRNLITQYCALNNKNEKAVFLWILTSYNRLIVLLSTRVKELEEKGSFSLLIDHLIKKHSQQNLILDFEGSMLPGVFSFNKSFGATTQPYISYKNFHWFERIKTGLNQLFKPVFTLYKHLFHIC